MINGIHFTNKMDPVNVFEIYDYLLVTYLIYFILFKLLYI